MAMDENVKPGDLYYYDEHDQARLVLVLEIHSNTCSAKTLIISAKGFGLGKAGDIWLAGTKFYGWKKL